MTDSGTKFILFGDVQNGYWWRLRSPKGETLRSSGRTLRHKAECEREVYRLKDELYPSAQVRDATIG
jgi:uncharacterized protein YegP (UPF0339 family)